MLKHTISLNRFSAFKVGNENFVEVSMLQFADNTLFIGGASIQNAILVKCILRGFELVLGLKINISKSRIVGISVGENNI